MTRAARNLTWEVLAKGRITLAALAATLAVACVVATWRSAPAAGGADGIADLFTFAMVFSMLFVFGMFNHTHLDRRSGQSGFPNRLFTLPVPTRLLVGIPMLCGIATLVLLYLAWTRLALAPLGRTLPVIWPALLLAGAMAWYQATLWCLAAFRLARLTALCLLGTALVTAAVVPAVDLDLVEWTTRRSTLAGMLAVIVVAYAAALCAVKLQRHGGGHGSGLRSLLERAMDLVPSRGAPFRSPAHAQFWLEARGGALLLPAGMLLVMLSVLLSAAILGRVDARLTQFTLWVIVIAPLALAALAGSVASLPIVTSADSSLSPFLSIRPIDCGGMVAAKLGAAAVAVTIAWLIVLALTPLWLWAWCDATPLASAWATFSAAFPGNRRWMMLALCAATMWLLTWRMAVINLYVAVTGRPVLFTGYVMAGVAVAITAVAFVLDQFDTAIRHGPGSTIFGAFVTLAVVVNLALLAKLTVAVTSTAKGLTCGWVTARSVASFGAGWAIATSIVATTLYLLASRAAAVQDMPWLGLLAAAVGLTLVPLARIALAPQMLAENRHR